MIVLGTILGCSVFGPLFFCMMTMIIRSLFFLSRHVRTTPVERGPFSEPDFVPILVPIFSAYFGLSSTEIGSKSVYSDKGIEKRSYLIKATPSLFVAISPTN